MKPIEDIYNELKSYPVVSAGLIRKKYKLDWPSAMQASDMINCVRLDSLDDIRNAIHHMEEIGNGTRLV